MIIQFPHKFSERLPMTYIKSESISHNDVQSTMEQFNKSAVANKNKVLAIKIDDNQFIEMTESEVIRYLYNNYVPKYTEFRVMSDNGQLRYAVSFNKDTLPMSDSRTDPDAPVLADVLVMPPIKCMQVELVGPSNPDHIVSNTDSNDTDE